MPLYTYRCECGHEQDGYNPVSNRHLSPSCETCGKKTKLAIVPVQIAPVLGGGSFDGYKCPITDEYVTSRKRRREIIKENNLIEKG